MFRFSVSRRNDRDEDLMTGLGKGNRAAFDELYRRYSERCYSYFRKMLWQESDTALDFTQTLFLKLLEKPELYDGKRSFKTWLFSIASNMCKNEYRRRMIRQSESLELHLEKADHNTRMEAYDIKKFMKELEHHLDQLDEAQRETFLLRYAEQMSLAEIAAIMECPEGTVKSRLYYVLKKLSQPLKEFRPDNQHNHEQKGSRN